MKSMQEIDAWQQKALRPYQPRKQFLVLTGPSKLGKTKYVRYLFAVGSVLELNCAGLQHVCLQDFHALRHRCILWDECSPGLVSANRKLFQHPACWLDMGHSPTGQHVIKVWLNDACSDYSIARRVLTDYHPLEPEWHCNWRCNGFRNASLAAR